MDLTYTDGQLVELGALQGFSLDFDTTAQMDFRITTSVEDTPLRNGYFWYIDGTEYGGRIDKYKSIGSSGDIEYEGRNLRGILASYVIEPLSNDDYAVYSGLLSDVINRILKEHHLDFFFVCDQVDEEVIGYQFNRYITVYDGIVSLATEYGYTLKINVLNGIAHISFAMSIDYTNEDEYSQDDTAFNITKVDGNVNHLICLGQGELADRMVIHLYSDDKGNISTEQFYFGLDEIARTYESTNSQSYDELYSAGVKKLQELNDTDKFEVIASDIEYQIGDIVGGRDRFSKTYVAKPIENIIVTIDDDIIDLDYKVGQDDTNKSRADKLQGRFAQYDYALDVSEDGNLYLYYKEGKAVPEFSIENGNLYVDSDAEFEYHSENGTLYLKEV